jgi:ABC-type amino acid transport substrate-binding protein
MNKLFRIIAFVGMITLAITLSTSVLAQAPPVADASALRVGVAPTLPPMIFKEGKNIVGVEADFAQALGRALGRPVVFVELPWEDLIDALEASKIDIIMSSMSITRARQTRVAFSEPYLRVGQMALVRANEKFLYAAVGSSFAKQTIGVKKGTTGDLLVQQEFPKAKRKYFDTGDEGAKALAKKKIDLFISDSTVVWYLAGRYEAEGLVTAPMVFSDEVLAWGTRRSDPQLLASVNSFIKKTSANGELNQVLRRWMPKFE